jgi:hypothetical protein
MIQNNNEISMFSYYIKNSRLEGRNKPITIKPTSFFFVAPSVSFFSSITTKISWASNFCGHPIGHFDSKIIEQVSFPSPNLHLKPQIDEQF